MKIAIVLLNYNDAEATIDAMKRIEHFKAIDCIVVLDNASAASHNGTSCGSAFCTHGTPSAVPGMEWSFESS